MSNNETALCGNCGHAKGDHFLKYDQCRLCGDTHSFSPAAPPPKCERCKGSGTQPSAAFDPDDPCDDCNGTGVNLDSPAPPPKCEEIGHVEDKSTWANGNRPKPHERRCLDCGATDVSFMRGAIQPGYDYTAAGLLKRVKSVRENFPDVHPPAPPPASTEKELLPLEARAWKPTEEMVARRDAFHGECFAVDYGTASDYDEAFAEKMREREKWYNAGWQGRKRYETEKGENDEQD